MQNLTELTQRLTISKLPELLICCYEDPKMPEAVMTLLELKSKQDSLTFKPDVELARLGIILHLILPDLLKGYILHITGLTTLEQVLQLLGTMPSTDQRQGIIILWLTPEVDKKLYFEIDYNHYVTGRYDFFKVPPPVFDSIKENS
jgi:hypothetical protein